MAWGGQDSVVLDPVVAVGQSWSMVQGATRAGVHGLQIGLLLLLVSGPARSQERAPLPKRAGFSFGVQASGALGELRGYPNDLTKIDRPEHFFQSGAAGGFSAGGWLGVAMSDALVFGLSGAASMLLAADRSSQTWMAGLHVGVFPLHALPFDWRWFRAVTFELDAGFARSLAEANGNALVLADTGVASHVRLGLGYELIQLGPFRMGPMCSGDFVFSPSAQQSMLLLGWNTALYSGGQRRAQIVDPG